MVEATEAGAAADTAEGAVEESTDEVATGEAVRTGGRLPATAGPLARGEAAGALVGEAAL